MRSAIELRLKDLELKVKLNMNSYKIALKKLMKKKKKKDEAQETV